MLCDFYCVQVDDGKVLRSFRKDIALSTIRDWRELYHLLSDYQKRDIYVKFVIVPYSEEPF